MKKTGILSITKRLANTGKENMSPGWELTV